MTGNNFALSGLRTGNFTVTQGSASLHPGLRILRPFGTKIRYQFQWWATSLVGAQPYQGKKKGADSGIDGLIFFHDDKSGAKKIVVSVKGGENVSVAMVRDFAHVIEREQAAMGFFVTLAEPSMTDHAPGPMSKESVAFGFYDEPRFGAEYPKLQILTIEGLMSGTERPRYPDLSLGRSTFKKAAVEEMSGEQERIF
ncbi:MAG: restriction endonuclease [Candidatus Kapaibacterium sp.]